jgi:hypothetical protein
MISTHSKQNIARLVTIHSKRRYLKSLIVGISKKKTPGGCEFSSKLYSPVTKLE